MSVVYRCKSDEPVTVRYVRYCGAGEYRFCEVGQDRRFDQAQGTCSIDDLPADVAMAAISRHNEGVWPSYVDWPLSPGEPK